jgi:hypothetical protein
MDEQQVSPGFAPEPVAATSFGTRAVNALSAPTELYTEVAAAPVQSSSWVIPLIITILLSILTVVMIYNNTVIRQQIMDLQQEGMKKAVAEHKMTQDQADKAAEMMESGGGTIFMIFGSAGAAVMMLLIFFLGSLVLWLVTKFLLKSPGGYKKIMEIFGLSMVIGIIGAIVSLLTMNYFGSLYAVPAVSAFFTSLPPTSFVFRLLATLNIFTIWQVIVLGIGLAKVSAKPTGTGIGAAMGCWLVFALLSTVLNFGGQ